VCTEVAVRHLKYELCTLYASGILFLSITNMRIWAGELQLQPDRQCTCNVTLSCGLATIVVVEKQCVTYCECVCNLSYPACYMHVSY
jgi:hypothetical protein